MPVGRNFHQSQFNLCRTQENGNDATTQACQCAPVAETATMTPGRPARRELATHAGTSAGPSCPGHGPITLIRARRGDLAVGSVTLPWRTVFRVEIVDGRPLMCMAPSLVEGAGRIGIGPVAAAAARIYPRPHPRPFISPPLLRSYLRPQPPPRPSPPPTCSNHQPDPALLPPRQLSPLPPRGPDRQGPRWARQTAGNSSRHAAPISVGPRIWAGLRSWAGPRSRALCGIRGASERGQPSAPAGGLPVGRAFRLQVPQAAAAPTVTITLVSKLCQICIYLLLKVSTYIALNKSF